MSVIRVLLFLGLQAAAAAAQKPKPCVSPLLMTGGISVMASDGLIMSTGKISYDAFSQRARVTNMGMAGNETFVMDQLMFFNKKFYYEIDWRAFSCKKKALNTDFNPLQVPKDAKLMGQVFMGSSSSWGMGILINSWYGELPNNGMYSTVFTETGCIPVTTSAYAPEFGWTIISTFNWVLGSSNPMDFHPPAFCHLSNLELSETPDTMITALTSLAMKTRRQE